MSKTRLTITGVLLSVWMTLCVAVTAFAHSGPKTITIDAAKAKQPAVTFNHEIHHQRAKSCDVCHHTQKGITAAKITENSQVQKCANCHLNPKDAKTPSMREASLTKNPFHTRCIACHKEQKKGPVACTGCHVKGK